MLDSLSGSSQKDAQTPASERYSAKTRIVVAIAIALLTFLVFAQARAFDFINVDDPQYVTRNDRVRPGLSADNVRWAFTAMRMANWHPLAWISHMADVQLFGLDPGWHHLSSALLHSINGALLYLVLMSLTGRPWRCAIVAVVWAIHPLRMESVAWIAERKDVLCATFFFVAIWFYGLYVRRQSWAWYGATIVAYALGLLAKPMIVTFPCVLLLIDYWPLKRPVRLAQVVDKFPFFAMALVSSVVTYIAQQKGGAMDPERRAFSLRVGNAIWAYGRYIAKTLWPADLSAFYPYYGIVRGTQFPWTKAAVAGACLFAVTILALWIWHRRGERSVMVGWLWFLGMLVPTIGLLQVGSQSMADRYSYLPQIGLLIAIVWGIGSWIESHCSFARTAQVVACVFAGTLTISTLYQLRYWRDSYTLFSHALEVTDHNAMAHMCVGIHLSMHGGSSDEAIRHYRQALALVPKHAEAHNNLGAALLERDNVKDALAHLRDAVDLNPKYAEARNNLANALVRIGQTDEAIRQYEESIRLDPDAAETYFNYAVTLASLARVSEAIPNFEHALRLRPNYVAARSSYALALVAAGRVEEGKQQFQLVLQSRPDWTDGMGQFAWTLATSPDPRSRDPVAAVSLAEFANKKTVYDDPRLLDALGAAYASAERFDKAVDAASKARDLAAARGMTALVKGIDDRVALYRSHRPYIATTQPAAR